jgi:hypothetical protein
VNCTIKYNNKKKRLEVRASLIDIKPHEEIFIGYGEEFWAEHLDEAPINTIIKAYPAVTEYTQYINREGEGEYAANREGEDVEPPRKVSKRTINRISREYAREFLIKREKLVTVKVNKRRIMMARIDILTKKAKNKKLRKVESKKKKKRGYDNPSLAQARKRDDWPEWEKAVDAEYNQMIDVNLNHNWTKKAEKWIDIIKLFN